MKGLRNDKLGCNSAKQGISTFIHDFPGDFLRFIPVGAWPKF